MLRIDPKFAPTFRDREFYEKTDPGISASDNYQPSKTQAANPAAEAENAVEKKSWAPKFFAKRRAVKEAAEIVAKLERLATIPAEEAARYFFDHDLPRLVACARIHPKGVEKVLRAAATAETPRPGPWTPLVRLACGDPAAFMQALENSTQTPAYLRALERVAAYRPREAAHLLRKFFEQADLKSRMAALRTAAVSENLGDGHLIGELFVKLMAATTAEERQKIVEPFLESLLQKSATLSNTANNKVAWLGAYYHGWKNEALG